MKGYADIDWGNGDRLLILDAGSSKTYVAVLSRVESKVIQDLYLPPINAALLNYDEILARLSPLRNCIETNDDVAYFGAGCMPGPNSEKIAEALQELGIRGSINVESDIISAAISLLGNNSGIACILGTGSNTAKFSDTLMIETIPSLGYVLGDEGSGAALGKRLVKALFRNQLSHDLLTAFTDETGQTYQDVIEHVYRIPDSNRYLAQFTHFIKNHIDSKEIENLVTQEFESFFINRILPYEGYQNLPIGVIGSVAKVFEDQLLNVAKSYDCKVVKIVSSPMDGLIEYFIGKRK